MDCVCKSRQWLVLILIPALGVGEENVCVYTFHLFAGYEF